MKLKVANSNMAAMSVTIIAPNGVSLQLNGFNVLITCNLFVIIANLLHRNSRELSTYVESPARTS